VIFGEQDGNTLHDLLHSMAPAGSRSKFKAGSRYRSPYGI
jgi:hypothetical protein